MRDVKFISYDGQYPNLCSGTLEYSVDGEVYLVRHCLNSGGGLDENGDSYEGVWTLAEEEFEHLTEAERLILCTFVNTFVPHGCCGGCA